MMRGRRRDKIRRWQEMFITSTRTRTLGNSKGAYSHRQRGGGGRKVGKGESGRAEGESLRGVVATVNFSINSINIQVSF